MSVTLLEQQAQPRPRVSRPSHRPPAPTMPPALRSGICLDEQIAAGGTMGWLSLKMAGLFVPRTRKGGNSVRAVMPAPTCVTIDGTVTPARYSGPCDWSDYLDEVPSWRIAQEAWANAIGVPLPDYRTRREFEEAKARCIAAIALCEQIIIEPERGAVVQFTPSDDVATDDQTDLSIPRRLKPRDAAEAFLADLRELGETGPHSDARMSQLYAEHCARYELEPTPENVMRAELKKMNGIWKEKEDKAKSITGSKRERRWVWVIAASDPKKRVAA